MANILLVEENKDIATMLEDALSLENHAATVMVGDSMCDATIETKPYDLIILGHVSAELTALGICSKHRTSGDATPIMFLSANSSIDEKEKAFDAGADDYVTKPFHVRELIARVKALLRRPKTLNQQLLKVKDIVLDPERQLVTKGGVQVKLYPRDFALFEYLLRYPNQIFSAQQLLDCVWRSDSSASVDTVRQCLMRLRRSFKDENIGVLIRNIHGVGYRLEA